MRLSWLRAAAGGQWTAACLGRGQLVIWALEAGGGRRQDALRGRPINADRGGAPPGSWLMAGPCRA